MSCKIIEQKQRIEQHEYRLKFDMDEYGGGYAFPCDKNGNVFDDVGDAMLKSYHWCLNHLDRFVCKPYVEKDCYSVITPAKAKCQCGEIITLENQYRYACQCPKCGQWYNTGGQELLDPEYWEDDYDYNY